MVKINPMEPQRFNTLNAANLTDGMRYITDQLIIEFKRIRQVISDRLERGNKSSGPGQFESWLDHAIESLEKEGLSEPVPVVGFEIATNATGFTEDLTYAVFQKIREGYSRLAKLERNPFNRLVPGYKRAPRASNKDFDYGVALRYGRISPLFTQMLFMIRSELDKVYKVNDKEQTQTAKPTVIEEPVVVPGSRKRSAQACSSSVSSYSKKPRVK